MTHGNTGKHGWENNTTKGLIHNRNWRENGQQMEAVINTEAEFHICLEEKGHMIKFIRG